MRDRARAVFCVFALSFLLLIPAACESSGGGNGGGTDVVAGTCAGAPLAAGMYCFQATLKDFKSKIPSEVGYCWLLHNSENPVDLQGNPVDASKRGELAVPERIDAGAGGAIEYQLPAGSKWGWFCQLDAGARDTYQFNIAVETKDEELWIVSQGLYELASQAAGVTPDQAKTMMAGRLVWWNATGTEDYLGCMTIDLEEEKPEGDPPTVHYFSDLELPDPEGTVPHSNPINGLYMGANMELGILTTTARKLDGTVIGTAQVVAKAGAIVISNIEATGGANPMKEQEASTGAACAYQ